MAAISPGCFDLKVMSPDPATLAIAELVARAERVKRNREIILHNVQAKPGSAQTPRPATLPMPTRAQCSAYLRAVGQGDRNLDVPR